MMSRVQLQLQLFHLCTLINYLYAPYIIFILYKSDIYVFFNHLKLLVINYFSNKNSMTEADVDSILKKYEKGFYRSRDLMYTERKKQAKDPLIITFMDNNYTPTKELKQSKTYENTRVDDLLKHLQQSEKRLVISERNYAEVSRKYQKIKQAYDTISLELQRERKIRLQQIIDTQNKLDLLQADNDKNVVKLESKQQTIAILKQKLQQKQNQISSFQTELQQISRKLCETLQLRSRQSIHIMSRQLQINQQEAHRSLEIFRQKYEKSLASLKEQNNKFISDLLQKQKEKKRLLIDIEQITKKHLDQVKQLKSVMAKNEQQYKNWLDQSKKQKLQITQKYQQQIRQYRKQQFNQKLAKSDNLITQSNRNKSAIKQMQAKIFELQNQSKANKIQIQTLLRADKQAQIKINSLQEQLKFIKGQYSHQIGQNKNLLMNLKSEQDKNSAIKKKNHMFQIQIQSLKNNIIQVQSQKKRLQKQLQNLKSDMGRQLKSLISIKKELNQATNNQLNINSTLTQASSKLHQKITYLQSQLQQTTIQLYAQRIQKAKLQEQLEQTKTQLKRQYQLSIQNTKRQLQQQIKQRLQAKTTQQMQKQQAYLKMFQIQRNYQLLKSEVVTVDEILKMGAKMSKYYKRKGK